MSRFKKFYNKIFGKKVISKEVPRAYVTPKELSKITKKIFEPIIELKIPDNDKPNILIMDDDYASTEYLKQDLYILDRIGYKLRTNDSKLKVFEKNIIKEATPSQIEDIKKIDIQKYNIICVSGNMAAFSVMKAIDENKLKNVKIAILDIILGGFKIEDDNNIIYDGIDISEKLWNNYKDIKIMYYTGCTIGKHSEEAYKFREKFPDRSDILNYTVFKDLNITLRQFKILDMLSSNG